MKIKFGVISLILSFLAYVFWDISNFPIQPTFFTILWVVTASFAMVFLILFAVAVKRNET